MNKINILQTHLLSLRSIYEKCKSNVLPKILVDKDALVNALSNEEYVLEEHGFELVYGTEIVSKYYELETVTCVLKRRQILEISIWTYR